MKLNMFCIKLHTNKPIKMQKMYCEVFKYISSMCITVCETQFERQRHEFFDNE